MTMARPVRWSQRANGPLMARKINNYIVKIKQQARILSLTWDDTLRAGDGNRTRMTSLEGWSSTIELRPQQPPNDTTYAERCS
jgi:hypothetical protein